MALASIHDRANGRKQVTSPLGATSVGDLPEHRAHANGLLAGVIRRWNGDILQKQAQVLPNLGLAFLQASPVGVSRLAG
jgi:hypothetical protein